jgi:hypothetical protein
MQELRDMYRLLSQPGNSGAAEFLLRQVRQVLLDHGGAVHASGVGDLRGALRWVRFVRVVLPA